MYVCVCMPFHRPFHSLGLLRAGAVHGKCIDDMAVNTQTELANHG